MNRLTRFLIRLNGPTNNVNSFIKRNWKTPTDRIEYIGLSIKEWNLAEGIRIVHTRQVRGDLIEVFLDKKLIIAFVDQSHAYGGLLGVNDVSVSATNDELDFLYSKIMK